MSERSRKVMDDLKLSMAYAIDLALDGDLMSGYSLCEDSLGQIVSVSDRISPEKEVSELRLDCPPNTRHKASIIITPKI